MLVLAYGMRVNLSVAIVAMTDPEASSNPDIPVSMKKYLNYELFVGMRIYFHLYTALYLPDLFPIFYSRYNSVIGIFGIYY